MELSTSFVTFLEFTLEMSEDVLESETALARQAHAATHAVHANEHLWLHHWAMLAITTGSLFVEYTKNTGSDLVADDGFVVFAENVDAELLV